MERFASNRTLAEWLGWLETLSPNEIDLGLDRVSDVLRRLQLRSASRVIHVAGTNGKGSSVAMLEALYLQQGVTVGSFTSPHLYRYNERIRVAGHAVDDEQIVRAFERIESVRQDLPLTYFEFGTLAALCVFEKANVDTIILEVGMGGRLDAVNAVEPDGGIITNVALDHMAWLGDNRESIAAEKAGILRSGKPFIFASDDLPQAINRQAEQIGADLRVLNHDYRYRIDDDKHWSYFGPGTQIDGLRKPVLRGDFQVQNAAGVLALVEALQERASAGRSIKKKTIDDAFSRLQLSGRLQFVQRRRLWIFDVAHNAAAASVLANSLRSVEGKLTCIVGILDDKNISDIIGPLLPCVGDWIAVTAESSRAVPAPDLAAVIARISAAPCGIEESIEIACKHLDRTDVAMSDGPVLVTGSFLTVGPALRWLAEN